MSFLEGSGRHEATRSLQSRVIPDEESVEVAARITYRTMKRVSSRGVLARPPPSRSLQAVTICPGCRIVTFSGVYYYLFTVNTDTHG